MPYVAKARIGFKAQTIEPGQPVDGLSDAQAKQLLASGSIERVDEPVADEPAVSLDKLTLDKLKALAAEQELDAGEAKTKADFIALLTAAADGGDQDGTE